jgi:hypothetical protein
MVLEFIYILDLGTNRCSNTLVFNYKPIVSDSSFKEYKFES